MRAKSDDMLNNLNYLLQEIKELQLHCQDLMDENKQMMKEFDDLIAQTEDKRLKFVQNYFRRQCLTYGTIIPKAKKAKYPFKKIAL